MPAASQIGLSKIGCLLGACWSSSRIKGGNSPRQVPAARCLLKNTDLNSSRFFSLFFVIVFPNQRIEGDSLNGLARQLACIDFLLRLRHFRSSSAGNPMGEGYEGASGSIWGLVLQGMRGLSRSINSNLNNSNVNN